MVAAQRHAPARSTTDQPTAIVYRTLKGWKYGVEGKASHGAGHKLCSEGFYEALAELTGAGAAALPVCDPDDQRCLAAARGDAVREECFWAALEIVRRLIAEDDCAWCAAFSARLRSGARAPRGARPRAARRCARASTPSTSAAERGSTEIPDELRLAAGSSTTLRGELGRSLHHLNQASGGALLAAAADLLGSTSVSTIADGFPAGFWNAETNAGARLLATGGICEDAMSGILSGISRLRSRPRRGLLLRRLPGAARAYRRAPARHRVAGAPGDIGRLGTGP